MAEDSGLSDLGQLAEQVGHAARTAGAGAIASGKWVAEWLIDNAPRISVRDQVTLVAENNGLMGDELAEQLITKAARKSAGIGATIGALMTAEEFLPPAWIAVPIELIVETMAVAAVEIRLVGELHAAYGRPLAGSPSQRGTALVRAWAERRGVSPAVMLGGSAGLADVLGQTTRNELVRIVRNRLLRRMGRNLATIGPMMIGAAAGAALNRRATRGLGERVAHDLARS